MLTKEQLDFIATHTARTTDNATYDESYQIYSSYSDLEAMEFRDKDGIYGIVAYRVAKDIVGFGIVVLAILVKNSYYIKKYREMVDQIEALAIDQGASIIVFSTNRPSMCRLLGNKDYHAGVMTKRL